MRTLQRFRASGGAFLVRLISKGSSGSTTKSSSSPLLAATGSSDPMATVRRLREVELVLFMLLMLLISRSITYIWLCLQNHTSIQSNLLWNDECRFARLGTVLPSTFSASNPMQCRAIESIPMPLSLSLFPIPIVGQC